MNGVHDLGGMHGLGPVEREENEPVFHAPWERTICGMNFALMGAQRYSVDEFRHSIERMEPVHYLAASYYERWLDGAARLLIEKGLISEAELEERSAFYEANPAAPLPTPASEAPATVAFDPSAKGRPHPYRREERTPPRFQIGDAVITVNFQPHSHTRLPRYARGKRGVINRVQGTFVFGDSNGSGLGEHPQSVYSVRFEAGELWGDNPNFPRGAVYLDLWESHLRPA